MKIYSNTSNLIKLLSKTSALSRVENLQLENALIERTVKKIDSKDVLSIRPYAFADCSSLTSVSFPQVTSIGSYAFDHCSSLTSVSFPACQTIYNSAFYGCSSLTSVSFPQVTSIGDGAFVDCSSLTSVSFPACRTISAGAFRSCTMLSLIYLTAESVCVLYNSSVFQDTGITATTGSIFVPASLVTSYRQATNWVYFSNRIYAKE